MTVIYEPKGKAREYCERAVNLYRGCGMHCEYCYAPSALRMKREEFKIPKPRDRIIEHIIKEAPTHAGKLVLLCFTTDPYQEINDEYGLAGQAIDALHAGGCRVSVLTKGGMRAVPDFKHYLNGDDYGATLTFDNALHSREFEPNAADPDDRMFSLEIARGLGIKTWASLEPVIDPEQTLDIIRRTHRFVDKYKIGRWNYDKRANEIDWAKFARDAVELCTKLGADFYIKEDLAKYLSPPTGEQS